MAGRRLPPSKSLARAHGQRELPPSLIVVCEGNTEKQLLDGLRGRWRIPSARIELVGEAGVPSTVVRRAKELLDAHRSRYRRSSPAEVWVVFDRDDHPCWRDAIQRAQDLGYHLAVSNPCIELWALLLHQAQSAHVERDVAQRRLAQLHAGYHHDRSPYLDLDVVEKNLEQARVRADALHRRAVEAGDPRRNPSTHFPALIERLHGLRMVQAEMLPAATSAVPGSATGRRRSSVP